MMKLAVYVETSIVSYYTSRPSRDLIIAARQQQTHDWWDNSLSAFEVFVSKLVLQEAADGDASAAEERSRAIADFPLLDMTEDAFALARVLIECGAIPEECPEDALHIAVAAAGGVDYLLTWNFSHINNAETRFAIERAIREYGHECPVICTPEELMGG